MTSPKVIMLQSQRMPSVKKLAEVFGDRAKEVRELLKGERNTTDYASVQKLEKDCYHRTGYLHRLLTALNEIADMHGVEFIPAGSNKKSPSIDFLNAGDSYACTFMILDGYRYVVGDWGSIVERGNYS